MLLTAYKLSTYCSILSVAAVSLTALRVGFICLPARIDKKWSIVMAEFYCAPPNRRPPTSTQYILALSPLVMSTDPSDPDNLGPLPSMA